MIRTKITITEEGKITTEVIERTGNCNKVLQMTDAFGKTLSDERIGPDDDDRVEEINQ